MATLTLVFERTGYRLRSALVVVAVLVAVTGDAAWATARAGRQGSASLGDLPMPAQAVISSTLGRDDAGYHARAAGDDGFRMQNRAHGFTACLTEQGLQVEGATVRWGLALEGWGYGEARAPVGSAPPHAAGNRVEYRRGGLTEWYVNGPAGLEQGFTLPAPPAGGGGGPLTLELALRGGLDATVDDGGRGLALRSSSGGQPLLRYRGLSAADAAGRELHAWLELHGRRLLVRVNDTRARYPVTIDPFLQAAKLTASDGAASDHFGYSVAISGDAVVVGAFNSDANGGTGNQGSAYVFVKPGGGWATMTETAKLTASVVAASDQFGISVAISGDTVVVGAGADDIGANGNQGSAYVFVKPGGGWATMTETAKLTASDGSAGDSFGHSVAISGDTVVVGALYDRIGANPGQGSAYVFVKPGGGWATMTETAKLTASDGVTGALFGYSVAISGDTVVVGQVDAFSFQGSAYVFVKPGGGWATMTQTAKLTPSDGAADDRFGGCVAIGGDTVVVGAYGDDIGAHGDQGSAYVFVKPGGGWATMTQTAKLTASDGGAVDHFGYSVAISGDTVVAGAYGHDIGGGGDHGAAYVFVKPGGGWATMTETAKLTASDRAATDFFGYSVAISGDTVVVGAELDDIGANGNQGSAYVFRRIVCGDGILDAGEQCDDGNTANGDCCSAACQFESAASPCADDGNGCTDDRCDGAGTCQHPANAAPCSDGLFCNGADTCSGGTCSVHAGDPCVSGPACANVCDELADSCVVPAGFPCTDDGNPCTDDRCDGAGSCTHPNNTAPCSDGLFCNGADTCSGGACGVHAGDPCAGGPLCGNACNELADDCFNPAGSACTDDGNGCTDDRCDGAGTCQHPANAAPCSDGLFCNGADTCSGGTCSVHAGDPCVSGPACANVCDELADSCLVPAGFPCTDDGNPCTDDRCNGAGSCAHPSNTAPCSDGLFCNGTDTCGGGTCSVHAGDPCTGGPQCRNVCNEAADDCFNPAGSACTDDGNPCTDDRCDGAGACTHPANTASCDDGQYCTTGDHCAGGVCTGTVLPDGTACTDGDACTWSDTCQGGVCMGSPANPPCTQQPPRSVERVVGPSGDTLPTPDGTISLQIPAGALAGPTTISVAGGNSSRFGLGDTNSNPPTMVIVAELGPSPITFQNGQKATLTFRWTDAPGSVPCDDNLVAGYSFKEGRLYFFRDGMQATGTRICSATQSRPSPPICVPNCPFPTCGSCTTSCCDARGNSWALQVSSFSEYAMGSCLPAQAARVTLNKLSGPPAERTLNVRGKVLLAAPLAPTLDPLMNGMRLWIEHGSGTLLDVTIPGGALVGPGGAGWTVNGAGNLWNYRNRTGTPPAGITRIVIRNLSSATPGLVRYRIEGKGGPYAVAPGDLPLTASVALYPPFGQCSDLLFEGARCTSSAGRVRCR